MMKKVLVTTGMLMLLIGSLTLGMNLAIKKNTRTQEQSYMRMVERTNELHAKPDFVYVDCTVKEPSVPFFFVIKTPIIIES